VPLHHPLRLIGEVCMLGHLAGGRLEIGVGRGGVLDAYFWGQESDDESNQARYDEHLAVLINGLSHDQLTYAGRFWDAVPMRLRPKQQRIRRSGTCATPRSPHAAA
jgi:alkanesulfonate monooxygenase SsuD/methylene tetrahydromethanopterin reductase-like flavin-dependent oxidoreductase (luciferase family)